MYPESISKEEISKLPIITYEGAITLIDDPTTVDLAIYKIRSAGIVGFDTEKKPTFKKGQYHPTALVQLSTLDEAFLFRINKIGFHPALKAVLEDPAIIKLGISIRDDLVELQRMETFSPEGFVELNVLAHSLGIRNSGVRNLAGIILRKRVSKNQQTSNWENDILTDAQQNYSAIDAWICIRMYRELQQKGYIE